MRMRSLFAIAIAIAIVLAFIATITTAASAQPAGTYPYAAFEKQHLPIGTPVWVNVGITECAFSNVWVGRSETPSVEEKCFGSGRDAYRRATIVGVVSLDGMLHYELAIEGPLSVACVHASSPWQRCAASLAGRRPVDRSAIPRHPWCARPTRRPRPDSRPASCTGGAARPCRA